MTSTNQQAIAPQAAGDLGRRKLLQLAGASLAAFGAASVLKPQTSKAQDMSNDATNFYQATTKATR